MAELTINLALISLLGGVLSLDRRAAFQLMISQPLVAVALVGTFMGYAAEGVVLGAVLQLLWMSCVLFGANVPRNDTLASVTIGGSIFLYATHVQSLDLATWTLAILVGAPVCVLGQWLDVKLDHLNLGLAADADAAANRADTQAIAFSIFLALVRTFLANATAAAVTTAGALYLLTVLREGLGPNTIEALSIIGFYIVPSLGLAVALSMLRKRRGLLLALVTFGIVSAVITQGYVQ